MLLGFIRLLVYIVIIISCIFLIHRLVSNLHTTRHTVPFPNIILYTFFFNYKSHSLAKGDLSA